MFCHFFSSSLLWCHFLGQNPFVNHTYHYNFFTCVDLYYMSLKVKYSHSRDKLKIPFEHWIKY
jgi:hypothetical protein